jgi:hypothetical protein
VHGLRAREAQAGKAAEEQSNVETREATKF